ncbi:MAG TPA: DoxX family membrane protein [Candidatus Saccharimonadales bacterium]|nr:DoxX family membrane protein [Candidatus Saccharimonadales bacterium]
MFFTFAHVKWFVDDHLQKVPELTTGEWLFVAFAVLAGVGMLYGAHAFIRKIGITKALDSTVGTLSRYIPYIVRYTTGLLLIINAAKGLLFAPNVPADTSPAQLLSIVLALCGVLLIVGFKIRFAAIGILAVYTSALLFLRPFGDIFDHVEYIGIGLYLLLYAHKPYLALVARSRMRALCSPESLLRIFVGVGLMSLALTEKLVGIELSANFLQNHDWNFLSFLGISDRWFIIVAGIVELLVGLTLVLNIAPRITTAIVAGLMVVTAILLGLDEVYGHLFALSLVAVVWLQPELPVLAPHKAARKKGMLEVSRK